MKKSFLGYYQPSGQEYEDLWSTALIVLDTNVLLGLYRLPEKERSAFLKMLNSLKKRLWIPHQVALEFQLNRLNVIKKEQDMIAKHLGTASKYTKEINDVITTLKIDKRELGIDPEDIKLSFEAANKKMEHAIQKIREKQADISLIDDIRETLDQLFESRVGPGPTSQADLDSLIENGEDRFTKKIPPGFSDSNKDKNPNEATFAFDGIQYERKFGDLILWRQLIKQASDEKIKKIIFVTSDTKEDWWWKEDGKILGPKPELIREISREGGVPLFWMYSLDQFLERANENLSTPIPSDSMEKIKEIYSSQSIEKNLMDLDIEVKKFFNKIKNDKFNTPPPSYHLISKPREIFEEWLSENVGPCVRNPQGSPDYILETSKGFHGYELKNIRSIEKFLDSSELDISIINGSIAKENGDISLYSLALILSEEDLLKFKRQKIDLYLRKRITPLIKKGLLDSLIIGSIADNEFLFFYEYDKYDESLFP